MENLIKKVAQNKRVRLDKTFFPKHKRVLVKRTRRVLNKPVVKKKKVVNSADKGDLLDSQSLWDSQRATCSLDSEKNVATPVNDDLLDSQCSISFLDSQGTTTVCSIVCWIAYRNS